MLNDDIVAALATLDVDNDDHWTADGFPRVDVVQEYLKQDVNRGDITSAAKTFSRKNPELPTKGTDKVVEPATQSTEQSKQSSEPVADKEVDVVEPPVKSTDNSEDSSLEDAFADATAELDEARKVRDAANTRYAAAQDVVDNIIRQKEKGENTSVSNIYSIKAFQRSQFELRRRQLED